MKKEAGGLQGGDVSHDGVGEFPEGAHGEALSLARRHRHAAGFRDTEA